MTVFRIIIVQSSIRHKPWNIVVVPKCRNKTIDEAAFSFFFLLCLNIWEQLEVLIYLKLYSLAWLLIKNEPYNNYLISFTYFIVFMSYNKFIYLYISPLFFKKKNQLFNIVFISHFIIIFKIFNWFYLLCFLICFIIIYRI